MATVSFKMAKRQQSGRGEILARFVAGRGVDVQAPTHVFVSPDHWDASAGVIVVSTRYVTANTRALLDARKRLDGLRDAIMDAYFSEPAKATTRDWLVCQIERYFDPTFGQRKTPVAELIDAYVNAQQMSDGSRKQYGVLRRMVERYGELHGDLMSDAITSADLDMFADFIRHENKKGRDVERGHNTISSKMKKLRAALTWATKRGMMPRNPFDDYSIPAEVYGTPVALSLAERDQIAGCTTLSDALAVQRDIFIFQCHVGCRVSDLMSFTPDNVVETETGLVLQYIQRKTRASKPRTITVPLDETASAIVRRYSGGTTLLPFISTDKYNDAIKRAIRQSGVVRMVQVQNPVTLASESVPICDIAASHLARRTFAFNLFKITKSERIVSSMTGHAANSRAFSRYAFVDDELKSEVLTEQERRSAQPDENPT